MVYEERGLRRGGLIPAAALRMPSNAFEIYKVQLLIVVVVVSVNYQKRQSIVLPKGVDV